MFNESDSVFYVGNNAEFIRRVQSRLRDLSGKDKRIPPIFIDGIYGSETREAVRAFQKAYKVGEGGNLDQATFEALDRVWNLARRADRLLGYRPHFNDFAGNVIRPGDKIDDVYAVQLLLRELSLQDDSFFVDMTGIYDEKTVSAVKKLQKILGAEDNGIVDRDFWNSLVLLTEPSRKYK